MWMGGPARAFELSNGPGSLGLSCSETGLALAGVPLLRRTGDGFRPRPAEEIQALIGEAYDIDADVSGLMGGLGAVARALNAGAMARAMIAAVQLRLPPLDWQGAVRIAKADALLKQYDPDEPRDERGRWTTEGADADPDDADRDEAASDGATADNAVDPFPLPVGWVRLPPGERVDELGDLLEWIANAEPEDAPAIRGEIKRLYYDAGDARGGDALNRALSEALEPGIRSEDRTAILRTYEPYTRSSPVEAGGIEQAIATLGALGAGMPVEVRLRRSLSEIWRLPPAIRGMAVDAHFGTRLAPNFPTIDDFRLWTAISNKSIDLTAATYRNPARLAARIRRDVDKLAGFVGDDWGDVSIKEYQILRRRLRLVVPKDSATPAQRMVIEAAKARARTLGVRLKVYEW